MFALDVVNGLLFSKMVNLLASLVEQAASAGDWIVVDRVRAVSEQAKHARTHARTHARNHCRIWPNCRSLVTMIWLR